MSSKKLVLIIEDDEVISSLLQEFLESENFRVASAVNGEEGLSLLSSTEDLPTVILLDLMMPVMDGFQFMKAQAKNETLKNIPVIAMSADNQIKEKLQGSTAKAYFKKPVNIMKLLESIDQLSQETADV